MRVDHVVSSVAAEPRGGAHPGSDERERREHQIPAADHVVHRARLVGDDLAFLREVPVAMDRDAVNFVAFETGVGWGEDFEFDSGFAQDEGQFQ